MAPRWLLKLFTLSVLAAASGPVQAQGLVPDSQVRAINTARDAAISANGGLGAYNPAQCMFETTNPFNPCLISNDANGYVFRFLGGPDGWQAENLRPTVQTQVQISPDGRTVLQMSNKPAPQ